MQFQKVAPGQEIVMRANEHNAMLAAGAAYLAGQFDVRALPGQRRDGIIDIRNDTAAAVKPYTALAIDEPLLPDTAEAYLETFAFSGITPDPENEPTHRSRVAILLAPAAIGDIVPALIRGQVTLPVHVYDTAHTRARPVENGTLHSCTFGPVKILAAHSTGANTICLCDVDGSDGDANWEVKTPSDGIDGWDGGDTIPAEKCDVYMMVESGGSITRSPVLGKDGVQMKVLVGNRSRLEIDGNRFVSATRYVGGALIVTFDDCADDESSESF